MRITRFTIRSKPTIKKFTASANPCIDLPNKTLALATSSSPNEGVDSLDSITMELMAMTDRYRSQKKLLACVLANAEHYQSMMLEKFSSYYAKPLQTFHSWLHDLCDLCHIGVCL